MSACVWVDEHVGGDGSGGGCGALGPIVNACGPSVAVRLARVLCPGVHSPCTWSLLGAQLNLVGTRSLFHDMQDFRVHVLRCLGLASLAIAHRRRVGEPWSVAAEVAVSATGGLDQLRSDTLLALGTLSDEQQLQRAIDASLAPRHVSRSEDDDLRLALQLSVMGQ